MPTTLTAPIAKPFYIGHLLIDPPILQAPMAGFTNYAFRQIVREFGGAGLLGDRDGQRPGFVWLDEQEAEHPDRLWGVADEAAAARRADLGQRPGDARQGRRPTGGDEYGVSVVDINFGCPVKQVTQKAHSGSYLLSQPERMGQIIEHVVAACAPTPVTAKIRLGCTRDSINAIDIAQVVEGAGAAALTVHGRTAAGHVQRLGRLGPHRRDQAASQADPADRQRRSRFAGEGGRRLPCATTSTA